MVDLRVDGGAVTTFAAAVAPHSAAVGAECVATGQALGSGQVQDALGNVSLVLTVLDRALAGGASELARDARSSGEAWAATDTTMSVSGAMNAATRWTGTG